MLTESRVLDYVEKVIRIPDLVLHDLSSDGKFAVFLSNAPGSYQLWAINLQDGRMRQISHGMDRVIWSKISPDSKKIVFTRDFSGAERHQFFLTYTASEAHEEQISKLEGIRVFDFAWAPNGNIIAFGGTTSETSYLWLFDMASGVHETIFKTKHWVFEPDWHGDSQKLIVSAKTTDTPKSSELVLVDTVDKGIEIYTPKPGSENLSPKWHPKKNLVLFKTDAQGLYDLAIYDMGSKSLSYLGVTELGMDFPSFGWTQKGSALWFVAAKNGRTKLYLEELGKEPIELPTPTGRIGRIQLDKNDSFFIFSWSSLTTPPQLSKLDISEGSITTIHKTQFDPTIPLGKAEFLTYKSLGGLEVPAFILYSGGSTEPKPSVIWPHGGPWWEVADEWNAAIQALSVGGFHVFCPNFRGSTGYGAEFEKLNIKDPGGGDLQDVVSGAKYIMKKGIVKDGKIAIVGASYGGFLTFLAMTKVPTLWKAGAAIVGVTDWKEMYELSDAFFRSFVEELLGGKPQENPELYKDRSAINFVHQIASPILIWHRANDSRCPLKPVERFVNRLRELGKPHEFHVVADEGHGPQKTDNLVRQYKHVVEFLLRHLA